MVLWNSIQQLIFSVYLSQKSSNFLIQTKASKRLGIWGYTWLLVIYNVAFIMKILKIFPYI